MGIFSKNSQAPAKVGLFTAEQNTQLAHAIEVRSMNVADLRSRVDALIKNGNTNADVLRMHELTIDLCHEEKLLTLAKAMID